MKRGDRVVHGDVELVEKLGRKDRCPCGSGRSFKRCCMSAGRHDGAVRQYYRRD